MTIIENAPTHMYHESGLILTPGGYESTFCTLTQEPNDIRFQIFYREIEDKPTRKRFRVSIRRNSLDHQSYCEVEMFMLGLGWSRLVRTPILNPELKSISYLALDRATQEQYNKVFTIMSDVSCEILKSALRIL